MANVAINTLNGNRNVPAEHILDENGHMTNTVAVGRVSIPLKTNSHIYANLNTTEKIDTLRNGVSTNLRNFEYISNILYAAFSRLKITKNTLKTTNVLSTYVTGL